MRAVKRITVSKGEERRGEERGDERSARTRTGG